jgi:hypothetical protein
VKVLVEIIGAMLNHLVQINAASFKLPMLSLCQYSLNISLSIKPIVIRPWAPVRQDSNEENRH